MTQSTGRSEFTGVPGLHDHLFREMTGIDAGANILDVGCGTGAWLARLSGVGYVNLTGIDKDLSLCREVDASLVQADIDWGRVILPNGPFDVISAVEVIEHMQNPGCFVRFLRDNLARGGMVLITSPNLQSLNARVRFLARNELPNFDAKGEPTHVYPVTLGTFGKLLSVHGLAFARVWSFPPEGGVIYRSATRYASALFRAFFPDPLRGDIVCMKVQHARSRCLEEAEPLP